MGSRKSYFTAQLRECDYGSGSRCRYYWGKGWWQEPTGSSRRFPGVICRGTRRNRVSIVVHFRVCGAERGRGTGFPFLSALEVFRRSQVPLLRYAGNNAHFHRFSLCILPSRDEVRTLCLSDSSHWSLFHGWDGMGWDEGGNVIFFTYPNKIGVERCPWSALNTAGRGAGAFAALSAACTWVIVGRTICQMHHETSRMKDISCQGYSRDDNMCSILGVALCPWHGWWCGEGAVSTNACVHWPRNRQISSPGWVSLGMKTSFSKPQREGVKVTGSSCKGGGQQMQEHILLYAPRSTSNYSYREDTLCRS